MNAVNRAAAYRTYYYYATRNTGRGSKRASGRRM